MVDLLFRHDSFRPGQGEVISDVWTCLKSNRNIIFSAGTGTGKTDSALSPALTYALQNDLTVFFLTPKNSQHEIALDCIEDTCKKYELQVGVVDFIGKRNLCLNDEVNDKADFYRVCSSKVKKGKCAYYNNSKNWAQFTGVLKEEKIYSHAHILRVSEEERLCAYETAVLASKNARVIIADYNHIFAPTIREGFLKKTGKKLENSIVVIDELHNLPQRMRDHQSASINDYTFEKARRECELNAEATGAIYEVEKHFAEIKEKGITANGELSLSKNALKIEPQWSEVLFNAGTIYLEKNADSTRSAAVKLGEFLELWQESGFEHALLWQHGDLSVKCLDPSPLTSIANKARSVIGMSGTLHPVEMYLDILGFDKTRTSTRVYESAFNTDNKGNVVMDNVTTKYDQRSEEMYDKIAANIKSIVEEMNGETAIFFPSYVIQKTILSRLQTNSNAFGLGPRYFVQVEGMNSKDTARLIAEFKKARGVLFGVVGGSLSEGIDYSDQELKCIVIVGLPLVEMNAEQRALIEYYDKKFKRGLEYGYLYPCMNKVLQASGRGIRSEKDKCVVIYMDARYNNPYYKKCFPQRTKFYSSNEPWKHFREFF